MIRCSCNSPHPMALSRCCCHNLVENDGDICLECKYGTHGVHPQQILDPAYRDKCRNGQL